MDLKKITEQLKKDYDELPFGNSNFQLNVFGEDQKNSLRNYRHVLLQLHQKLVVLKECEFRRRRIEIDIEEIEKKIETAQGFDKKRLEIDLEEKEWGLELEVKFIKDAGYEFSGYMQEYERLKSLFPQATRQDFEMCELPYWKNRFVNEAKREALANGRVEVSTLANLEKLDVMICRDELGRIAFKELEKIEDKTNG